MITSARNSSRARMAAAMMREVLPSTSPTTRSSCAMTQRSRRSPLNAASYPSAECSSLIHQCRAGRFEECDSELSWDPEQNEHPDQVNVPNRQFAAARSPKIGLNWRVLGILNLYRFLVPLVLLGLYWLGGSRGLPVESPRLFLGTGL